MTTLAPTTPLAEEAFNVKFLLNTALCQSPPNISKTQKSIYFIKHFSILSRANRGSIENGVHHITIVLTNKSLAETEQWKYRLERSTKGSCMNIRVLSSKKNASFSNLAGLIDSMVTAKSANDLPDMLVMCTHSQRTTDVIEFWNRLKTGNINFSKIGIRRITLSVMFDEADKNIKLIADCLKNMGDIRSDNVLRDVHFITATPFNDFWKILESVGITTLSNINHSLRQMDENSVLHGDQTTLLNDYRRISDHTHRSDISYVTNDPVEYATRVIAKVMSERKDSPLRIFAPATILKKNHMEMMQIFVDLGFTVLVMNGETKGFYTKGEEFMSLADYRKLHKIEGELKDVLIKWESLNPTKNITITGFLCIERGITFCTKGFNFTDMIISHYHLKDLASLIQLLGRANGGKEYVQILNIWAPNEVIAAANDKIAIMNKLMLRDPEVYRETDFRKPTKREVIEPAMTVPIVIQLSNEEYATMKKVGRSWEELSILTLLETKHSGIKELLRPLRKHQITEPSEKNSIKKHIDDFIKASDDNRKLCIDIPPKERTADLYQIYLDKTNYRAIISIYNGSKLVSSEEESEDDSITHV